MAVWDHERNRCPQCGGDPAVCRDADVDWYPQRHICLATAAREVAERMYHERFKAQPFHDGSFEPMAKEYSEATPWHYTDGVTIGVGRTDTHPDDDFLGQESVAEKSPGDEG